MLRLIWQLIGALIKKVVIRKKPFSGTENGFFSLLRNTNQMLNL